MRDGGGAAAGGSASNPSTASSNRAGTESNTTTCADGGLAESCAADPCSACVAPTNGTETCNAGTCEVSCNHGYVLCSDQSCNALSWSFETGSVGDFYVAPDNSPAVVGTLEVSTLQHASGSGALKVDMQVKGANRSALIMLDLCGSSHWAYVQGKRLSVSVFLDGPTLPITSGQHSVGLNLYEDQRALAPGVMEIPAVANNWLTLSAALDRSFRTLQAIGIYVFVNGPDDTTWTGSVYIDDVHVE
jgi:hypothetical protein